MAIPRSKAIKLLTASEQRYYEASRTGVVNDHGATRLKKLIAQVRNARDKARGRVHDLKRSIRGKTGRIVAAKADEAPQNSQLKQELFNEILHRLEAALERALARDEPNKPAPRGAARKATKRRAAKKARSTTKEKPPTRKNATKAVSKAAKKPATTSADKQLSKSAKKVAKRGTRKASRKTTVKALAQIENAPKGAELLRKSVQAAQLTHAAHDRARGRRKQAKRDKR